jgi:hypothetical protein
MSIDTRSRLYKDVRNYTRQEVFDEVLPAAITANGALAGRGVAYKGLPPLGLDCDGEAVTLRVSNGMLQLEPGTANAGAIVEIGEAALSDLVQDIGSTMGLAMTSRVQVASGTLEDWIGWEPALRALLDGRPIHETGDVVPKDSSGDALDLTRSFDLEDDREEVAQFLNEAGFLHIRGVFEEGEMAAVGDDIDEWSGKATPDDGASWWAEDAHGVNHAVRVLWFNEKSAALAELLYDERLQWLGGLTGDDLNTETMTAEGLVKPLDIVNGLSDLPWHKDCGQGHHSYMCSGLTVGISVTGADQVSGALGVIPGSHRANTIATMRDPKLDLEPLMLETRTGDITVHCSDTLHRAHPPRERPRKVVYTGFRQRPDPDDVVPEADKTQVRSARAGLTNVRERIETADNAHNETRFRADPTK